MRVAALLIALASVGCGLTGPSEDLSGNWIAQSVGHTDLVGFTLQQSGDQITGTACEINGGTFTWFSGAPVVGEYPNVRFTVAATHSPSGSSAGTRFSGKRDSTRDIVGTYTTPAGNPIDLRFKRSTTSLCN